MSCPMAKLPVPLNAVFAESYRTMLLKDATVIYVLSYGEVACSALTQCLRKAIGPCC